MKPLKHTTGIDKPPRWARRLLTWLHPEETLEEVEGDLDELYQYWYKQKGQTQATLRYVLNVVSVLPPFVHRRQRKSEYSQPFLFHPDMLSNYLKIAFRNLVKNKVYSFINIGGLAIGISVAMLIGLWIYDEISFDKYHKNYDSIGQIWQGGTDPETTKIYGNIALQYPVANVLTNNYKQYFKYVLMGWWFQDYTLSFGNNKFIKKGEFIDNDAPDMLSLKMLKGSLNSLKDPHSIILAKSVSDAIFGKIDPINKALKIDNRIDVIVTGVFEDMPKNNNFAQIQFYAPWDLWVSSNDWIQKAQNNWSNQSFNIYVQLQPNITMEVANTAIKNLYDKNAPKEYLKIIKKYQFFSQVNPMKMWHLYSELESGKFATGRIVFVWLFSIIGLFVITFSLYQFYEFEYGPLRKTGQRSRHS